MADRPPSGFKEKVGGAALLACGALLLKVSVVNPLAEAAQGGSHVSYSGKGVVLVPGLLLLGACLLVLPTNSVWRFLSRPSLRDPATNRATPLGWGVIVLFFAPGLVLYVWMQKRLRELGYH